MIYDIAKYLFGVTGSIGAIDRVAFWTMVLAGIAWWQLGKANKTTRADFIHRFVNAFFTEKGRTLVMLFQYDLLKLKTSGINSKSGNAFFELDQKSLNGIDMMDKADKETIKQFYQTFEIDDRLLGHFEDLGIFESKGLLDIQMVYDEFSYYVETIWENKHIRKYIEWLRTSEPFYYEQSEYIYDKIKSYEEAKKSRKPIWLWRIQWWLKIRLLYLEKMFLMQKSKKIDIKKMIAKEGLILLGSIILALLVDQNITYVPQANTAINHIKNTIILTIFFCIVVYLLVRFILWAIKTLREK